MNYKLRATAHSGGAAIVNAIAGFNIAELAIKMGMRKPARLQELAFSTDPKPATVDELVNLCAVMSDGLLRYDVEGDAIITDSTVAMRTALTGRNLASLGDDAAIPVDLLSDYREGRDCLTKEDLDMLAVLLFDGRMKIDHEALTLVSVGPVPIEQPKASRRRRPLPYPSATSATSTAGRTISLDVRGFPPVATGSMIPEASGLKSEPKRAGHDRMTAKFATIPYMR